MSDDFFLKGTSERKGVTIEIDEVMCKGCNVCVEVCPVDALDMVSVGSRWQGFLAVIKDLEACTGCLLCELQCPDFAIAITVPDKKKKKAAAAK